MLHTRSALLLAMLATVACSSSGSDTTDPRAEAAAFARNDIPCTTDADCCVVFDLCLNDGYVVAAKDKDKVASLVASADKSRCTACIPPSTEVSCAPTGFCTGAKVECTGSFFSDGAKNHCGKLTLPTGCTVKPASTSAPGPDTKTITHCG